MRFEARLAWLIALFAFVASGCNGNPFAQKGTSGSKTAALPAGQNQPYDSQVAELQRKATQLDVVNRDLTTQNAQTQQQTQIYKDQLAAVQKQLSDTAKQLQETQVAKQEAEKKVDTIQAAMQKKGGAIITANNSVRQQLKVVELPGLEVRQDEDLVRIDLPSDQLFSPASVQLTPGGVALIDQVAAAITANYPRQRICVEGHMDATPGITGPGSSAHQISGAQANVVLEQLTTRNRLPTSQFFTTSHGANHPRYANVTPAGRAKNRRVEFVVYPETYDSR